MCVRACLSFLHLVSVTKIMLSVFSHKAGVAECYDNMTLKSRASRLMRL